MKSIAIFNNKGGVGKTTLTYHAACALSEIGHKVLLVDLDPQSSLTLYGLSEEEIDSTWSFEEPYIEDFQHARSSANESQFCSLLKNPRSVHFLLKPTEDGVADIEHLPPPNWIFNNLGLISGRLSLHTYEDRISSRWSDAYRGDPLAIRTITKIRNLCERYAEEYGFTYALVDTSPSLGILNKVIISTLDGFLVPCAPDAFSLYGIGNIGRSLGRWKKEFDIMSQLQSEVKRRQFPQQFVQFLGFSIYNARRYYGQNELNLASAHYNYARKIPETIKTYISNELRCHLSEKHIETPIGGEKIMHSHSTLPNMAQKYRFPMWKVPDTNLERQDKPTIMGNRQRYYDTKDAYIEFANDLIKRVESLEGE